MSMSATPNGLDALQRLRDGNKRFVDHVVSLESLLSHARRGELAESQTPCAVILGCSDSRAPVEFIFDQGVGDLFVIRVAGNIAAPSQIGSIEFAVERFGVRLVVVLGHSSCGAVRATLDHYVSPGENTPGLKAIVDRIGPSVLPLAEGCKESDVPKLMPRAVRANVRSTVNILRNASTLLERLRLDDGLLIIGADYDIESGHVEFFDGVPES